MNRLLLLTVSSFAIVSISHAQITKGTTFLGGGISYGNTKREASSTYASKEQYIFVSSSVGKAIKENRVAGIFLHYDHRTNTYNGQPKPTKPYFNNYGTGFFLREYFPLNRNFYIYGNPSIGVGYFKNKQYYNITDPVIYRGWSAAINLSTGLTYALSKKFHLEAGLPSLAGISYERGKTKENTTESKSRSFNFYSSLSGSTDFSIGFRFLLPK